MHYPPTCSGTRGILYVDETIWPSQPVRLSVGHLPVCGTGGDSVPVLERKFKRSGLTL